MVNNHKIDESGDLNTIWGHKTWYRVVFLVVGISGIAIFLFANHEFSRNTLSLAGDDIKLANKEYRLQIEFDSTRKRAFMASYEEDMPIELAISRVASRVGISTVIENGRIVSVSGAKAEGAFLWNVYVNGTKISGELSQVVKAGDRIVVRYE